MGDHSRLGFGAAACGVEALEGEDDHEAGQDREAAGEDAEHPCGPVPVGEVAALRRSAADEQHRGDRHRGHGHDDEGAPEDAHRATRRLLAGSLATSLRSGEPTNTLTTRTRRRYAEAP